MTADTVSINAASTWEEIKEAVAPGGLRLAGHSLTLLPMEDGHGHKAVCKCGKTYRKRIDKALTRRAHQWHLGRVLRQEARAEAAMIEMVAKAAEQAEGDVIEVTVPTQSLEEVLRASLVEMGIEPVVDVQAVA